MAALGILTLDNEEYKILEFNYKSNQQTSKLGRPVGFPSGSLIDLTIESDKSTSLMSWMLSNDAKDGVVIFYKHDAMKKFKEFAFKKSHCISWDEKFEANSNLPMRQTLRISEPYHEPTEEVIAAPKKIVQQEKEETKVKSIKLITALDDGSANDNTGTGIQKGMVFGKTYEFKVTDYTQEIPENKSTINWMVRYHDLSKNQWVENKLSHVGETLKFTVNEKEMCGRFIYIRAYIKDAETEGELKVWKHNRFRMLDRQQLVIETGLRSNISSAIDQGGSSLCGIAVVGYYLARDQPKVYSKFILDMHRKGTGTIESNNYTIDIDKDEHLIQYKQSDKRFPTNSFRKGKMLTADFIFLVVIKDFLNNIFDYDPDDENAGGVVEGSTGLTLPGEIASMMKNVTNYNDIINDTNLITSKWQSASASAEELRKKITGGYKIGILINVDNFTENKIDLVSLSKPTHWVGLLDILADDKLSQVKLTVFTWSSIRVWTVSYDAFKNGYYGYVGGK